LLSFSVIGGHPLFVNPVVDGGYHHHWAQRIVAGDWLGHGPDDVFKPPFYAYFLAGWYALAGPSIPLIQWVQFVLGALSCWMAARLAARMLGRNVGTWVGIASALYAPYVFFELQLLTPSLSIFLNLAALLILIPTSGPPSYRRLFAGGLLVGLSAGVRPDVLLPAGMILLFLLWRKRADSPLTIFKRIACLFAGVVVVILPITARNAMLTGQWIPVSSNAGINFYTGNSSQADGISAVPVGLRWERLVSQVPQPILEKPASASRWWVSKTVDDIAAAPQPALFRLGTKALAFLNRRELRNNICFHWVQDQAWPFRMPFLQFGMLLPLAVLGMIGLWQDPSQRSTWMLLALWIAGFWCITTLFFASDRYRIPAMPILMIPAAWALLRLSSAARLRQWNTLGWSALMVLAVGTISWPLWLGHPQKDWVRDDVNLGNALRSASDFHGAEQAYRRALTKSNDPDAHFMLAKMLLSSKRASEALQHLELARQEIPDSPDLLLASAQAHRALGKPQHARQLLNQLMGLSDSCNLWPKRAEWATSHILLAELESSGHDEHWERAWSVHPPTAAEASFLRRKDMSRVRATFRHEAETKPWDWYAQANYGLALLETGDLHEAIEPLRLAVELSPKKEVLRFQLARVLTATGGDDEALTILQDLIPLLPESPLLRDAIKLRDQLNARKK
jgi:tetratricopeptide (TPR) repeat protein